MPGLNRYRNTNRNGRINRVGKVKADSSAHVEELGAARRGDVYRDDVPHAEPNASKRRHPLTFDEVQHIGALCTQGMSHLNIANEVGVSQTTVQNTIRKYGFTKGTSGGTQ